MAAGHFAIDRWDLVRHPIWLKNKVLGGSKPWGSSICGMHVRLVRLKDDLERPQQERLRLLAEPPAVGSQGIAYPFQLIRHRNSPCPNHSARVLRPLARCGSCIVRLSSPPGCP